jgi:hypothetical protein
MQSNWIMLFTYAITVYSESHVKHKYTVRIKCRFFKMLKQVVHIVTTVF